MSCEVPRVLAMLEPWAPISQRLRRISKRLRRKLKTASLPSCKSCPTTVLLDEDGRAATATSTNNQRQLNYARALQLRPENHCYLIESRYRSLRSGKLHRQRHHLPVRQTRLNTDRLGEVRSNLATDIQIVAAIAVEDTATDSRGEERQSRTLIRTEVAFTRHFEVRSNQVLAVSDGNTAVIVIVGRHDV